MFRMLQNQSNGSKQMNPSDIIINNWHLDEWTLRMKSNFKGEKWACFALIGVLCCDVFLVLSLLAYKEVFTGKIRIPIMIACILLTCSGVVYLIISFFIYQRKKKETHRVQYENTKEYMTTQLSLERKIENRNIYEESNQQIIAEEIQPGVILGKVINKDKPFKNLKMNFSETV
uniref:Transmembrane protein n=1 Tax=Octopus bimaculoides TaxID=37653 RepID=A0A0L8G3X5_OCTBM